MNGKPIPKNKTALRIWGQLGGRRRTKAKANAARKNGARGGRPRKQLEIDPKSETARIGKTIYPTVG